MIAIKGMEMPERCFNCPLRQDRYDDIMCRVNNLWNDSELRERPKNCPLIEIADVHQNPEDGYKE